jgi:predicted dehydrogenase
MAQAIRAGRPPRASGELMFHVLDTALAIHEASAEGRHVNLLSTISRPEPFSLSDMLAG